MITRRQFGLGIGFLGLAATPTSAQHQSTAAPRNLGKVFDVGPSGRCDDFAIGSPVVRWNQRIRKWMMWYYCRDRAFPIDVAPSLGSGRIAVATSNDGIQWDRYQGPEFGGSIMEPSTTPSDFDSTHIGVTDVTYHQGRWYLWYFGGDHQLLDVGYMEAPNGFKGKLPRGYRMRPGLAISDDGFSFKRLRGGTPSGAAVDYGKYSFASWSNGTITEKGYRLYYTATIWGSYKFETEVAVSRDGRSWTVEGPISWTDEHIDSDVNGIMTRHVLPNPLRQGKKWLMLYTAIGKNTERTICAAHSDDGTSWSRLFDTPILTAGPNGHWDDGGVATPQLAMNGAEARLYYFGMPAAGNSNPVSKGVGLAVSLSGDLRDLKRVSS